MTAQGSLLDRMHSALAESGRTWTAGEIAGAFLRLRAGGPAPDGLVRSVLRGDPRFCESSPGCWSAVVRRAKTLADDAYILAWVESGEARHPERWRLHLCAREGGGFPGGPRELPGEGPWSPADPRAWQEAARRWRAGRLATFQPGALGRLLQWTSRRWAFPEPPEPLDLLSLSRLALVEDGLSIADASRLSDPNQWVRRWGLGPVAERPAGVPFPAMASLLDLLLERYGSRTEDDLGANVDAVLGVRPVSFEAFRFARSDLEAIPDASGIYRFYGPEDEVLYIGKALRLRRRVTSYFRPLPPEPGRRDDLLAKIRRFEVVPLPSELEALVLESRGIRTLRPPWNVQVEVQEPDRLPPEWWWPLLFLAPGDDPMRATALLLHGAGDGWLFHLPRTEQPGSLPELSAWLRAELEISARASSRVGDDGPRRSGAPPRTGGSNPTDRPAPPAGACRLELPEVRLALRFFLREQDRLERIDATRCLDADGIAAALLRGALESGIPDG